MAYVATYALPEMLKESMYIDTIKADCKVCCQRWKWDHLNPLLSFPTKVTAAPNPSTLLCHYSLLQVAFGFLSFVFSHVLTISSFVDTLITIK